MGMAASQARLLCITARIHDVEYQAQAIQNAKMQLATQSDRAYEEYNEALAATTLTINAINPKSGASSIIAATFNNLCSRNRVLASDGSHYAIRNKNGLLVVEDEIEQGYFQFKEAGLSDAHQFALFMVTGGNVQDIANIYNNENNEKDLTLSEALVQAQNNIFNKLRDDEKSSSLVDNYNKLLDLTGTGSIYNTSKLMASGDQELIDEYNEILNQFQNELYQKFANEIYQEAGGSVVDEIDSDLFNYFVSIYKQIQACGGCVSIEDYNGVLSEGETKNNLAAEDSDWLQNMVRSGQFSIEIINTDKKTGKVTFDTTSPSSDSCLTYSTTTMIDNRALAKAEAEYEHTLKQIDKKDQKFDLDLSKLETERKALTTEYESVKKVIEENIDRTFGIFS